MKRNLLLAVALVLLFINLGQAQTTAMDFNRSDCNGTTHHLFDDLDSNRVVIIEFFMQSCGSCITAGNKLEDLKSDLSSKYPGQVKSYAIGFSNSYTCSSIINWVSSNSFTSIPMDSGGTQVAYYGGMGMPTVVVVGGGTSHSVLGTPYLGLSNSDTATMGTDIRGFLDSVANETPTGVGQEDFSIGTLKLYPNPANDLLNLNLHLAENGVMFIDVLDLCGRRLATVANESIAAGTFTTSINTAALSAGNYILSINNNGSISRQPFIVVH